MRNIHYPTVSYPPPPHFSTAALSVATPKKKFLRQELKIPSFSFKFLHNFSTISFKKIQIPSIKAYKGCWELGRNEGTLSSKVWNKLSKSTKIEAEMLIFQQTTQILKIPSKFLIYFKNSFKGLHPFMEGQIPLWWRNSFKCGNTKWHAHFRLSINKMMWKCQSWGFL